jgi:hypothetical protein
MSAPPLRLLDAPDLAPSERLLLEAGRAEPAIAYDVEAGAARFRASLAGLAAAGVATAAAEAETAPAPVSLTTATPTATPAPTPTATPLPTATATASPAPTAPASPLPGGELQAIALARSLVPRDPGAALGVLDRVRRDHPHGYFVEEREALTVFALSGDGQQSLAKEQAAAFLRAFPNGPYSEQVRAVLAR